MVHPLDIAEVEALISQLRSGRVRVLAADNTTIVPPRVLAPILHELIKIARETDNVGE